MQIGVNLRNICCETFNMTAQGLTTFSFNYFEVCLAPLLGFYLLPLMFKLI